MKILFADDNEDLIEMLRINFRDAPFECDFVESGEELLSAASNNSYDLIISDLAMSPVGGWEALEKIRESNPRIRLWALSAHTRKDEENDVRAERAYVLLLEKPADIVTLKERIREAFDL
jgi:DNA-binding response OmpR family regulator